MKKLVIVVLLTSLLLTGCTMVRIDTKSIDNIIGVILEKNNTLYNQVGKGYKYYVPRGVTYMDTIGFNDILYSNGIYYYLYIDAVGYINKIESEYEVKEDAYYSKKIDENNKQGYLEIIQQEDKYLINFKYNYAIITALVNKDDINSVVLNATYILSTIKYNDNVISLMLKEDYFINREEQFTDFVSTKTNNSFLKAPDEIVEIEE